MDSQVTSDLMQHLAGEHPAVEHAPDEIKSWLESLPLPITLKRMLQCHWPKAGVQLGPICMYSPSGIQHAAWTATLLRHSLIQIGDCANGDAFVVDFQTEACNVGFITLAEHDDKQDVRQFYQPVFRCLATFLYRVAEDLYVLMDYYSGQSYAAFLGEERNHNSAPPFPKER
jgi:hypothetical protein